MNVWLQRVIDIVQAENGALRRLDTDIGVLFLFSARYLERISRLGYP